MNILKVKDIYLLEMAKFMYLYHSHKLPKLFNQYFIPVNSVHNYNTRNASRKNISYVQFIPILLKKHCLLVLHKFGTTYPPNGRISLITDLKKLSNATLLRIIAKSLYQSASSNLMRWFCKKVFFLT